MLGREHYFFFFLTDDFMRGFYTVSVETYFSQSLILLKSLFKWQFERTASVTVENK